MKRIAVIAGDGVGKEVVTEGLRLLHAIEEKEDTIFDVLQLDLGAERFLRDGTTFPQETQEEIRDNCDAVLLGALGDPRVPNLAYARDILFGLRFGLDLYCNLRPVECLHDSLMPLKSKVAKDCRMIVFRENTEGIYVNMGGTFKEGTPDEVAISEDLNTRKGVERIVRAAFEYARRVGAKKVHMADKHNAMSHAHGLWKRCFFEVAKEYDEIEAVHMFVDAMCMFLLRNPAQFEVVVTCNLFGDIITDLGASLQGGMGMAASGNIHPGRVSLFEPVHGSAPDIAGKGIANPIATFLSVGMMLTHLGFGRWEEQIKKIATGAIEANVVTPDLGGRAQTFEVTDFFLEQIG